MTTVDISFRELRAGLAVVGAGLFGASEGSGGRSSMDIPEMIALGPEEYEGSWDKLPGNRTSVGE